MNQPLVSIIIVSYNVKNALIKCVESIFEFTKSKIHYEIIIIDNGSEDGTSKKLFRKYKNLKYINNYRNIGFTRALNQGADIAEGIFLFQLNPDTVFIEDTIYKLHIFFSKNDSDILGPTIIDKNGKLSLSSWEKPSILSAMLNISSIQSILNKFFKKKVPYLPINVDSVSGAAMFYKKKVFDEIGRFNEDLFWDEDIDFCIRAKEIGKKVTLIPNTKLIHLGGKSSINKQKVAISNQILSKIKFFKIHNSKIEYKIIILFCLIIIPIKVLFLIIFTPFAPRLFVKIGPYLFTLKLIIDRDFSVQLN